MGLVLNHKISILKIIEKFNLNSRLKPVNPKGIMYVIPSGSRNVLARSLALKHQGVGGFDAY